MARHTLFPRNSDICGTRLRGTRVATTQEHYSTRIKLSTGRLVAHLGCVRQVLQKEMDMGRE